MIETMADGREHTHTRGMHYSCRPVRPELEVAVMTDRQRVWDAGASLPPSWSPYQAFNSEFALGDTLYKSEYSTLLVVRNIKYSKYWLQ